MKPIQIEVKITKRIGNYESATLGGVWSINEDDTIPEKEAFKLGVNVLLQAFLDNKLTPQQAPQQKKKLTIESPELSAITKRISEGVSVEEVLKYYEVDDKMLAILKLAEGEK